MCDPEVEELHGELSALKQRCAFYRNSTLELRARCAELETKCMETNTSKKQLKIEYAKQLKTEKRTADQKIAELTKQLAEKNADMARMKKAGNIMSEDFQKVKKLHAFVLDQVDRLRIALDLATREGDRMAEENDALESRITFFQTALTFMESKVRFYDAHMILMGYDKIEFRE